MREIFNIFQYLQMKGISMEVWFTCDCGNSIDRDLNASINIKEFGANSLAY